MVGPSKILTVSYGTFSCTLEGFDDPFNTMKAIAEYFRDLAADDRYFGAEPPTPDAAMLHRIAEREIQRRVEARVQDNRVILRAAEGTGDADALPDGTPVPATRVSMPAATVLEIPATAPEVRPASSALSESVAAKLQRLRAAAAATPTTLPEGEADTPALVAANGWDNAPAPDAAFDRPLAPTDLRAAAQQAAVPDHHPAVPLAAIDDTPAEAPEAQAEATEAPEARAEATEAQAEAIEAQAEATEAQAEATYDTDIISRIATTDDTPAKAADDAILIARLAAIDDLPTEASEAQAEATDDTALIARVATLQVTQAEAPEDLATTSPAPVRADLVADELPESTPDLSAPDVQPESLAPFDADTLPENEAAEAPTNPAVLERIQRARARAIKIRRSDADTVLTAVPQPVGASAPTPPSHPPVNLTAVVEEALARDVAAPEAETAARTPARPARADLPAPATDDSVQRLIAQTNSQLEGPENRRRLSAIAHLKAAVAATVADRRAKGAPDPRAEEARFDPYRNDLERVVRPHRPDQPPQPGQGPRPAPLVLVSEQRIDRPRPAGTAPAAPQGIAPAAPSATVVPVRPRRISGSAQLALSPDTDSDEDDDAEDDNLFVPAHGFAEFAEKLGAQTLPDLLEAAAAYAACVEGRPHVSRPQIMRQVAALRPEAEQSRETLLRSFGTLLRDGRIEKVRRGQFALTESSRYLAEGRRIAP